MNSLLRDPFIPFTFLPVPCQERREGNGGEDRMMMCNVVMNELLKNMKTSNDRLRLKVRHKGSGRSFSRSIFSLNEKFTWGRDSSTRWFAGSGKTKTFTSHLKNM